MKQTYRVLSPLVHDGVEYGPRYSVRPPGQPALTVIQCRTTVPAVEDSEVR
jgi:hypothetical protein